MKPNSQLAMYADAALVEHELFNDFKQVKLIIVQPANKHVSEFSLSVPELKEYIQTLRVAAEETRQDDAPFNPTADNCFFCPANRVCEARQQHVLEAVLGCFDDLSDAQPVKPQDHQLGDLYGKLKLIRDWCNDIDARVMQSLEDGQPVTCKDGSFYKLVAGKQGNRRWTDEARVIEALRQARLKEDQIFNMKLISPTDAEKLAVPRKPRKKSADVPVEAPADAKPTIGPIRWAALQEFIERAPGKPEVALSTDPRPVYGQDLFDDVSVPVVPAPVMDEPIVSDLF